MSDTHDPSRREFVAGATAAVALGAAAAGTGGPARAAASTPLTDLGAVEAIGRMTRGEISAEHYASALLARCAARRGR